MIATPSLEEELVEATDNLRCAAHELAKIQQSFAHHETAIRALTEKLWKARAEYDKCYKIVMDFGTQIPK